MITFVATNAIHQIRYHTDAAYKDSLEGDPSASDPTPKPLTRRRKESRLANIADPLSGSHEFIELLRRLDDRNYRDSTSDYRNLNMHAIGPRLVQGVTKMVTRKVVVATWMEPQANGTFKPKPIAGKFVPSYSFGGTEPLNPETARKASLKQYHIARDCFDSFTRLLRLHTGIMPRAAA